MTIMEQQNNGTPTPPRSNPYAGLLWVVLIVLFLNGLIFPNFSGRRIIETDYGTFIGKVDSGLVERVMIENGLIYFSAKGEDDKTQTFQTGEIGDPELVDRLLKAESPNSDGRIAFNRSVPRQNSPVLNFVLMWVLPGLAFYLIWRQIGRSMQARMQGGGNFLSFGSSGARIYAESDVKTTFADVAGQDEAKVPFFAISGSEFVQMFVGMGAAKVRDLFKQASEKAPCIIFIDEIDAVGKRRDGAYGGNDEREQTLNQLLTEMDGFDGRKGVVILAATNRPESLDKALLRPGRFDRRIQMELPDLEGRKAILGVHLKHVRHEEVDLGIVARATAGSSGAELANIVNEAALRAVRMGRKQVTTADLEESVETVIAGAQKKNKLVSASDKQLVACHEIGHALVAAMQSHSAPVHKITIIPRTSGALGYTMQVEDEEELLQSRESLFNRIVTLTGGRSAEELVCGTVTTGASNDIEQATRLARAMVTRFGMSERYDMMALETVNNAYLGGDASTVCSGATAAEVDAEVLRLIREAHAKAREIISANPEIMRRATDYLVEKETITGDEFMKIVRECSGKQ